MLALLPGRKGQVAKVRMFDALPPYLGGKRRLLGWIFKHLPGPDVAPRLVDPFCGGGSVALYAKYRGYEVTASDIAERGAIVAQALIENSIVRLAEEDLVGIAAREIPEGYAETRLSPSIFPREHARFFDQALSYAGTVSGPRAALVYLLVIKMALALRAHSNFGAKRLMAQIAAGDWEEMAPHYAIHAVRRGVVRHPVALARDHLAKINRAVFSNGHENHALRGDAFDILPTLEAEICICDPPYPGVTGYERSLRPLDSLLLGRDVKVEPNPFTVDHPEETLRRLLSVTEHFPVVALTYGNKVTPLETIKSLMNRHGRKVEAYARPYEHLAALARKETRAINEEYLIIGRSTQWTL